MLNKSTFSFVLLLLFTMQVFGYSQSPDGKKIPISVESVYYDGQDVYVVSNGKEFPIQSLQKTASGWVAKVDNFFAWCIGGHAACPSCESCHKSDCVFYVPSCVN